MTVNVWPAIVRVPVREAVVVLAATDQVTVPLPLPLAGVHVSQATLLNGVQAQPAAAVTDNVALLAAEPGLALLGEIV